MPQIAILCTFQIKTVNFILDPPLIETIKWDIPMKIWYQIIILPFKQFELIEQQYLKCFVPPTLEKSVPIKKCGFVQTLPPKYAIFF